jgi:pectin methylesterase-like acyl-CoA thioesterase
MHVCSDLSAPRDRKNHYGTIKEALAAARARHSDVVELRLKRGHYAGNIKVDKLLTIVGERGKHGEVVLSASIVNRDGKDLNH